MNKATKLDDAMFPVKLQPIFRLDANQDPIRIAGHRVVLNLRTQEPLRVVRAGYRAMAERQQQQQQLGLN